MKSEYKQVSKEEKEALFKDGAVLSDSFYEVNVMVRPECPRDEKEKHPNEYGLFFPCGMALVSSDEFKRMTQILEDDLNHAVRDEDSDDDISNIFRISFKERQFCGKVDRKDVEAGKPVCPPFILPKSSLNTTLEELHKDLFSIFKDIGVKALTDDFDRKPMVDEDYEPSDFNYTGVGKTFGDFLKDLH